MTSAVAPHSSTYAGVPERAEVDRQSRNPCAFRATSTLSLAWVGGSSRHHCSAFNRLRRFGPSASVSSSCGGISSVSPAHRLAGRGPISDPRLGSGSNAHGRAGAPGFPNPRSCGRPLVHPPTTSRRPSTHPSRHRSRPAAETPCSAVRHETSSSWGFWPNHRRRKYAVAICRQRSGKREKGLTIGSTPPDCARVGRCTAVDRGYACVYGGAYSKASSN